MHHFSNLTFHKHIISLIYNFIMPFHQPATSPTCHFANIPFCEFANSPFINLSFLLQTISPTDILFTCHFINLTFHKLAVLSTCHYLNMPFHKLATSWNGYFTNLPFCRLVFTNLPFQQSALSSKHSRATKVNQMQLYLLDRAKRLYRCLYH